MFKKIILAILQPFSLPHKIVFHSKKLFNKIFYETGYNSSKFTEEQRLLFSKYNINYNDALAKLSELRSSHKELEKKKYLPHSEHSTFFAGLSLIRKDIQNILEIGTFNGQNAFLLSTLFEQAKVTTVDLPRDSKEYINSYKRGSEKERESFITFRDNLISKKTNLSIQEKNSVDLVNESSQYDLIWVDGAHFDPIVTIDIINSIRFLNNNGLILCDDVAKSDSNPTWKCINILKDQNIIDFELIYKSLESSSNANPRKRTFISILKKK